MMRFELGSEVPDPKRAPISAGTIAVSYLVGGLIPLTSYILLSSIPEAFAYSVGFTGVAPIVFGGPKRHFMGINNAKSAAQTCLWAGLPRPLATPWCTLLVDWTGTTDMSALGQNQTDRSRAKPLRCPLWSEIGQKPAERICSLSARSRHCSLGYGATSIENHHRQFLERKR